MEPSQETAGLLHFHLARTDVIRCVSPECLTFCKTMAASSASTSDKYGAMVKAVDCHRRTTREVMAGFGVDNHLLMLLKTADKVGLDKHPFFLDRTFSKSFFNNLRSTQVYTMIFQTIKTLPNIYFPSHLLYSGADKRLFFLAESFKR